MVYINPVALAADKQTPVKKRQIPVQQKERETNFSIRLHYVQSFRNIHIYQLIIFSTMSACL